MLERVHIKNFRSCRDVEFSVSEGVCALIGKNGAGKTNILKAVDWLVASTLSPRGVLLNETDAPWGGGVGSSVGLGIRLQENQYEYELEFLSPFPQRLDDKNGLREIFRVSDKAGGSREVFRRSAYEVAIPGRAAIQIRDFTPAIAALTALFPDGHDLQSDLKPVVDFLSGAHYYTLDNNITEPIYLSLNEYKNWRSKFEYGRASTDSVSLRLLYMKRESGELLNHFMSLVGPDGLNVISSFVIIEHETDDPYPFENGSNAPKRTLFFPRFEPSESMGGHGSKLPFSELSLGTRRIIRLITSLLFDKSSVMLIEHPEDSIHPELLRKLIDTFRTYSYDGSPYSSQILFTTHSPDVIDILKPEEVRFVTAEGGETRVRKLTAEELVQAKWYLDNEGALSQFLQTIDE